MVPNYPWFPKNGLTKCKNVPTRQECQIVSFKFKGGGAVLQKPVMRMSYSIILFVIESPQAVNTAATVFTRVPFFLLSHVNN